MIYQDEEFTWNLTDVNILVGQNGSGKTNLLKKISWVLGTTIISVTTKPILFYNIPQNSSTDKFTKIINKSFYNKVIEYGSVGNVSVVMIDGKPIQHLSDGENRLFHILRTVLWQNGRESTLILDDPETHLSIKWQSELIQNIKDLNPNCKVIIATHSPAIFKKGWGGKVVDIETIKTKRQ